MKKKPFFVGYLPIPEELKSFVSLAVPVIILVALTVTYFYTERAPAAGTGTWDLGEEVSLKGVIRMTPYPALVTADRPDHPLLIAGFGKQALQNEMVKFDQQSVEIKGYMIERGPWQMLEVGSLDDVSVTNPIEIAELARTTSRPVSLQGEIVDSKCMLGVMTPGYGKVHRACAALCMMGGLPPMLMVKDTAGYKAAYLLVDENGQPAGDALVQHVATPIELSGVAYRLGDMPVISINTSDVRGLNDSEKLAFGESIGTDEGEFCIAVM